MYDVVYVGSGPATIFSVLEHPKPNSLIIEKGSSIHTRDRKEVVYGFAGSGCWSDSKLIGSNGRVVDHLEALTQEDYNYYADRVLYWYNKFCTEKLSWMEPDPYQIPSEKLFLIKSRVCHAGTDRGKQIFSAIEDYIQKNICTIRFNEEVVDLRPCWDMAKECTIWEVVTTKRKFRTAKVVLATGTRDHLLKKLSENYDLGSKTNAIQIGVRIEIPNKYLKDMVDKFYDFKIAMNTPLGYWRTFCVNSGAAYVAVERDGNYVSANGHAFANKESTGLTNFGILGALKIDLDQLKQIEMAIKVNAGTSKLLRQEIEDFVTNSPHTQFSSDTTVSKEDYRTGDLWEVLPTNICQELKEYIMELRKHFPMEGHFFAPEINITHPIMNTDQFFQVWDGLFVIGDVMITRSIVDAGTSGMIAGEAL